MENAMAKKIDREYKEMEKMMSPKSMKAARMRAIMTKGKRGK